MTLEKYSVWLLKDALEILEEAFEEMPPYEPPIDLERVGEVLNEVAGKMQDNFPYPHPLYAGQMLKPPHPIARMAYMLSLWVNPNNHALDGGRASSQMEKEAVAQIGAMFGWKVHLGHLTSGGTMANLESLWIANQLTPGKKIVASSQAHYTHNRICGVLQIPFESVAVDSNGRMNMNALEDMLKRGDVGTVVVTMGTTAVGSVDPLPDVLELQKKYSFRIHADAAYGGYFTLIDNLSPETRAAYNGLVDVDSIAIDPHKHGLQPYGCGCVLFKDPSVGKFYKHDSPYTYFSSDELHLGEISLECSRAGASAVALWATQRLLPLVPGGEFAAGLKRSRAAALDLYERLWIDTRFAVPFAPELDIVVWSPLGKSYSEMSSLSRKIMHEAENEQVYFAVAGLPAHFYGKLSDVEPDQEIITSLRSCLMKPDHADWLEPIWQRLDTAAKRVLK